MLTGERRGVSARRMTVLGKIPVPKPINLPSQRLENRGLDPNVEIVPRGSVSWGSAGRSPPTINSAWGNAPPTSSPPVSSGAWGSKPGAAPTVNSATSGGGAWGGAGSVSRPTSGGSGTRPSSAGSIGLAQQPLDSTNSSNAWGARPSSASGVLGQAQSQSPASLARPRSADTSRPAANQFADSSATPAPPPGQAWGGSVTPGRLGEEPHQVSRFQLTRTDFPTLGSEKNPDLRPQHSTSVAARLGSVEEKVVAAEEGQPPTPSHYEELPPQPTGGYNTQERGNPDTWRREAFQGPPPMSEGNWHREGPPSRPPYGGQGLQPDNWRRETPPSGGPADDNWRRGGAPPGGQYGPPPGPGHYPHEGPGYMHQARFGLAPAPYGRGAPGPGGFGHHGDMYGNTGPLLLPSCPMHPLRPNMFQGPVPYDGFYGPPNYRGIEESERMMMGMGGGPPFGGYPQHQGPPPHEAFGRFPHGGMNQGPRHPLNKLRDRNEPPGEGYHESGSFHKEGNAKEGSGLKLGRGYTAVSTGRPGLNHDNDIRRGGPVQSGSSTDGHRQAQRGVSSVHQVGHRDWGAAASSDEPMDFSKPVFEEEVTSASPIASGKQSPAPAQYEGAVPVEEVKPEEIVIIELKNEMTVVDEEVVKKEEVLKVVTEPQVESVVTLKSLEEVFISKIPVDTAVEVQQVRDQLVKNSINVMDKDVLLQSASKEGPPKWERGSKRSDFEIRDVIGPADGVVTPSLSLGQLGSGLMGRSSILGNAPCSTTTDVLPILDISQPPNLDKPSSLVSPPASVSEPESQKAGEKVRILKRLGDGGPDSPKSDSTSGEAGVSENSVVTTPSVIEGVGKEGPKPKGRASSHDGEKEWRPKIPMADTSSRSSTAAQLPVSKPGIAAPTSTVVDSSDAITLESESTPQPGSYDYEAQRAKMKEIAAQRARQLQIEEEERIKEQKAKARAKLEELDRRSTVPPPATNEEPPVDISKMEDEAVPVEEAVSVDSRPVMETGSSSSSTRRSSRNDPAKRERDRKANIRKLGLGDSLKGKLNGSISQPPPLLPSPNVATAPLLNTPVSLHEIHSQQTKPQQQSRHRGRPEKKQLAARLHDAGRPMPAPLTVDIQSSGDADGWNMGPSALQDTDSREVSLLNMETSEGASTPHKKKGNRTSRNRQRQEGPAVSIDGIQFGDLIMGPSGNGSELPTDSVSASLLDPGKVTVVAHSSNVSVSGDALTGDEGSAVSTNGDVPSKQVPRKSHGSRRTIRGERGSQDVRLVDKPHTNDSKVWAPVRSPGGGGANKAEGADMHVVEPHKEDSSIAQQQAPAKRAELERYTPKPVMKQQEDLEQPILLPQRQSQATPSSTIQAAKSTPVDNVEHLRDFPSADIKQFPADIKSNNEPRQADPGSKSGRSHGSWRQRGPGNNDRGTEGARDGVPAQHSSGPTHGEHVHQRPRFEQKVGGGQPLPRRNQPLSDQVPTTPLVAPAPAPAPPVSTPVQALVQEREQATPQRPYQPPRPTSAPAPRGQDPRAQGPYISEHKGHDQGTASLSRNAGATSDRGLPSENAGSHHHKRTGGGHHMRQQGFEREQPPSQQVYTAPHLQPKAVPVPPSQRAPGRSTPRERDQQQQPPRGTVQHAPGNIDQGSHQRGQYEREQAVRPSTASQRGQGHWQQTGPPDAFRSAPARPHFSERDLAVTPQFARMEVSKQQVADSQRPPQFQGLGVQQNKPSHASQQAAPVPIPTSKVDTGHWVGEGGSPPVLRGRDYNNHGRRGRFGGRSGPRGSDMEHRRDHPPPTKQRLVIDATGGAVPSQVGG